MDLSTLAPPKGSRAARKRIGRGNASGSGRTAGKGEKGQKARCGYNYKPYFEGGQMPLYRRLPKKGFTSLKKAAGENCYAVINLTVLDRFDDGATVDAQSLKAIGFGLAADQKAGIKILAGGEVSKKLHVKVQAISDAARQKIEGAGGSVEILKRLGAAAE
jgi:large subunit ribosomal protein L15